MPDYPQTSCQPSNPPPSTPSNQPPIPPAVRARPELPQRHPATGGNDMATTFTVGSFALVRWHTPVAVNGISGNSATPGFHEFVGRGDGSTTVCRCRRSRREQKLAGHNPARGGP